MDDEEDENGKMGCGKCDERGDWRLMELMK